MPAKNPKNEERRTIKITDHKVLLLKKTGSFIPENFIDLNFGDS